MSTETPRGLLIRASELFDQATGDPSGSRAAAERLVDEARTASDDEALVTALRALAQSHRLLLAHGHAEPLLDEAVRLARRRGLDSRLGQVLATRGALRHEQGRREAALRDLGRAAALLSGLEAAEVELQRAALAQNAGRLGEAAAMYAWLLRRHELGADIRTRAANNLGLIEARLGHHRSAWSLLGQAQTLAAEVGPSYVALVAEGRAWAAVQAGRLCEGVACFEQAAELWRRADLPLGELYAEYADALGELRLLPEARENAERAASMLADQGVQLMAAEAQLRLARLALVMGDSATAQRVAEQVARQLRRQRRADWVARACLTGVQARTAAGTPARADRGIAVRAAVSLRESGACAEAAEAFLAAGRVAAATRRPVLAALDFRRAAAVSPASPVLSRVRGSLACALAAEVTQQDAELLRACRAGLGELARHRAALPSTELRALASGHGSELSALGLRALVRTASAPQVLAWMERTRANALAPTESPLVAGLDEETAALRAVLGEIASARAESGVEPRSLLTRQAEIEARIRRISWAGDQTDAHSRALLGAFSVSALRKALEGRVLVEYDVLDGAVLAAVVEHRRTRLVRLGPLDAVEGEIQALRLTLRALAVCTDRTAPSLRDVARTVVDRLTALLVEPLRLPDSAGVVVVPVGMLQRVPWSALVPSATSVSPSAALWMRTRAERPPLGPVVLAAGPRLEGAVEEVRALASRYPGARVLEPPDSGVDAVRLALDRATLAHLACHGHVRADNPTFSSLELSDGQLTVQELDRGKGGPYRLVLAACDVGSSVTYPGNEALGFVGTLLARGTAGLVASTTLVADQQVTPLMMALHDGIAAGRTLADALHRARGSVDPEDPRSFPAWCSFTAYGGA